VLTRERRTQQRKAIVNCFLQTEVGPQFWSGIQEKKKY